MKKKTTAGEQIARDIAIQAGWTKHELSTQFEHDETSVWLARRIDRAIRAAVRSERDRCMKVVFDQMLGYTPDGAAAALLRSVGANIRTGTIKPTKKGKR